jgi:hypothetical protein
VPTSARGRPGGERFDQRDAVIVDAQVIEPIGEVGEVTLAGVVEVEVVIGVALSEDQGVEDRGDCPAIAGWRRRACSLASPGTLPR